MLKRLANEYDGRIKVLKVDVDKNQARSARYEYSRRPLRTFLAAAVNVFAARREPKAYGLSPTKVRPFTHKGTVFLPVCSVLSPDRLHSA
jgi:hypothetical protein